METAAELGSRPLPLLKELNSRSLVSESELTGTVSLRLFHEWRRLPTDVLQTCASMDFGGHAPLTDDQSEDFVIESKLGLTDRFTKNACDAVSKVLSTTNLAHLKLGDYQASALKISRKTPDVVMLSMPGCQPVAVLQYEPCWNVSLESHRNS